VARGKWGYKYLYKGIKYIVYLREIGAMKNWTLLFCTCFFLNNVFGQQYLVRTNEKDSFSLAFVKLMNSGVNHFEDCKGELIRRSWQGDDYKLTVPLPGGYLGIVRHYLGNDVKIEYRGFADSSERNGALRKLVKQIKKALGDQLDGDYDLILSGDNSFYGMNIKDQYGYFSSTIEIFSGSSSASSYLLSDYRDEDLLLPQQHFFILKIDGGLPFYFYNVPEVCPPDLVLDSTIRFIMEAAKNDFRSFKEKRFDSDLMRRRGTDTILKNGHEIFVSYNRSEYTASLFFPAPTDSLAFKNRWEYYRQVVSAVTGTGYAYFFFNDDKDPHIKYFSYNRNSIELEFRKMKRGNFIRIKVVGSEYHPQKRGLDREDFENMVDWD